MTKEEKEILKNRLLCAIDFSVQQHEGEQSTSWVDKTGILLTRKEANIFLELLNSTMRTEEEERKKLKEWESSLYWALNEKGGGK